MRIPGRYLTAALLALVFVPGCALFRRGPEPYPSGLVFPLIQDGDVPYQGETAGLVQRTPAGLVLHTKAGVIHAIDEVQRKVLWTYEAEDIVDWPPEVGAEGLTLSCRSSEIHRLTFQGELVWKNRPRRKIATRVREAGGLLFYGTERDEVVALNAADGSEAWRVRLECERTSGPLPAGSLVVFGCKDGSLRGFQGDGGKGWSFTAGSAPTELLMAEEGRLYFMAEDGRLHAVDMVKSKERWKVRTNGPVRGAILVSGKRIVFLTANNVLYCLDRDGGDILWWQPLPARPRFDPVLVGERVVVATQSPVLTVFDIKTGLKTGDYTQESESRSNPVWVEPFLVSNLYDEDGDKGRLIFLKKEIKVSLNATRPSPIKEGDDVTFQAAATGLFQPKFEFALKAGEAVEVVQASSEESSWTWYETKAGAYAVRVKAVDEKASAEAELVYVVERPDPKPRDALKPAPAPEAEAKDGAKKDGLKAKEKKKGESKGRTPAAAKDAEAEGHVVTKGESKMTREEALELVKANLPNPNLVKHCLAVEACMRALAVRLGQDPEPWGLAGLLHDLDYEKTAKSPEIHTTETVKMLEGRGLAPEILRAIQAHAGKVACESVMDWCIYAVDPLTGLIIAATLMHPDKKLAAIDLEFIKRRYKEKSFAKGARREEIEKCVNAGIALDEFLSICIKAMQGIAADLGL
ncbi:MAG: PQQ-binding-like beta-propeller repeat protein [Candidatus Aminicenantes bacterium]|nr:PQQ-binding-like beta-propeller repeat protein [Candidatus Aminicenantes bacterium]